MRRLTAIVLSLSFFVTSGLLYAEAIKKVEKVPAKTAAPSAVRVTQMTAAGVVKEITDSSLKIEQKVKDQVEEMEFALEKPLTKIKAGDKVRVTYITKEDKNIAAKVTEDISPKVVKKVKKGESKPIPAGVLPKGK